MNRELIANVFGYLVLFGLGYGIVVHAPGMWKPALFLLDGVAILLWTKACLKTK